jgi:RNA polymerase sigma-70 factor (ECF subfamily)
MRSACREISLEGGDVPEASTISLAEFLVDKAKSPGSELVLLEKHRLIQDALERMDPLDREILVMRHFEMLSNNDISQILQASVTAASNRYVRAVKRLKQVLSQLDSSGPSA